MVGCERTGNTLGRRHVNRARAKVAEGGRIVIPAEFRKELGVQVGDEVMVRLEDGEVRISTIRQAIRRTQEEVRRWFPDDRSLADELIAERRAEAARE